MRLLKNILCYHKCSYLHFILVPVLLYVKLDSAQALTEKSFYVLNLHSETFQEDAVSDSIGQEISFIEALTQKVEEEGRFIDRLDNLSEVRYPIGVTRTIAGQRYTIVLDCDEITTAGAFLNAYMSFPIPQTGRQLAFAAHRVPLTAEGGLNGVIELALLADEPIDIGDSSRLVIYGRDREGNYHTKAHFNCEGFIDMVIDAGIEFNQDMFVPENPETGQQIPGQMLTTNFVTTIQSWSDMIVQVLLPPFQIKRLKGFGFEIIDASFDFSDISNPAGIVFPEDYEGIEIFDTRPQLWQGFYLRKLLLRLPRELNEKERLELMAQNVIIDDAGLTGTFAAENLLSLDEGSIGGWAFSLDRIELNLISNDIVSGGISGKINMPVMDSTDYMNYIALIDNHGDFLFSVSMPRDFEVPLFMADMLVYQTSTLAIRKEGDHYSVLATLNGEININAPLSENKPSKGFFVDSLRFELMQLGSMEPYFRPGIWSLGEVGYNTVNGFGVSFSNVEGFEQGNDVGLRFTASVQLSGEKYVASSTMRVIGSRYSETDAGIIRHKLKYKRVEVQDLYISVDAAISLEGYLVLYRDDPTYGDGFAGAVSANIVGKFGVEVKALFGEVSGFKYWYVDALANFSAAPIPIFTGLSLYGIGGGAYYHMNQNVPAGIPFKETDIDDAASMINYVPDKSVFLGFKATVAIATPSPKGFNAIATFEIVFNQNWGVNEVKFYGQGSLMSTMDFQKTSNNAPVKADVYVRMDFVNDVFYGNFKVYVNACKGRLVGINPGNLAGEMVVYADKNDWYIHVGRPSARIGLKFEVLGITIQNGSYFMMGTQINEIPPPPEQVLRILNMPVPDDRDMAELGSARGFSFGTYFSITTGDQKFMIFYGRFDMGLGFDLMLTDMGQTICRETGEKIGINGWYAQGQLYAFVEGTIGIDINVFKKIKIHEEILSIGAAVLLEARLPNPFWLRGTVGGYYSLMGGSISGNCRFQLELGQQCTLLTTAEDEIASPLQGFDAISEITPGDGRSAIDVFVTPQVVFNYRINSAFTISDNPGNTEKYRIVLDKFEVKSGPANIPGTFEWNSRGDVLVFNPRDILPGNASISLTASVHFEKYGSGIWSPVKEGSSIITETKTAEFETGEAPDYIPESNVAHSYPMPDMLNLYKNEFSTGYIQLVLGQEYLFAGDGKWNQYGRFTPVQGGDPVYIHIDYDAGEKVISHIIPDALLMNTIYKFDLVSIPAKASSGIDANIVQQEQVSSSEGGDINMMINVSQSVRDELQEKIIYTSFFRTSSYSSLHEKFDAIESQYTVPHNAGISPLVFNIISLLIIPEPFDKYELAGHNGVGPLLEMKASDQSPWIKNHQIPFIYEGYPLIPSAVIRHRDTTELGLVPLKNVYINTYTKPYRLLSDAEKRSGYTNFTEVGTCIYYNLSPVTWMDYQDIATALLMEPSYIHPRKSQILGKLYPSISIHTVYPVEVKYTLPHKGLSGTGNTINIQL